MPPFRRWWVQVARAMLDLTRPAELSNLGQTVSDPPSAALPDIHTRVNSAAGAAAVDGDGDSEMPDADGGGGPMTLEAVEGSVNGLEGSAIVQMDDKMAGRYYVDAATAQFMVRCLLRAVLRAVLCCLDSSVAHAACQRSRLIELENAFTVTGQLACGWGRAPQPRVHACHVAAARVSHEWPAVGCAAGPIVRRRRCYAVVIAAAVLVAVVLR